MDYIKYKEIEPDNTNLYENGTPFDVPELIYDNLIKDSIPYLKDNQPVVITIIGGQGSGKTTLGIHLIDIYNYFFNQTLTDLTDKKNCQYAQGGKDFLKKLPICAEQKKPACEWDESGRYSSKYALTSENREMDEALDVSRIHNTVIIIVRHDINKIPKELLEHEILGITIRCKKRKPGSGYTSAEVYDFEQTAHLIRNIKLAIMPQYVFGKTVYPNFHFRFKSLSPKREQQLKELSGGKKREMWDKKTINSQGFINIDELHIKLNMSQAWVRKKIQELKIKPEMIHKKRNYYNQETVQKLKNRIK